MQALFDFITGLLSALAALAFAQFGVSVHGKPQASPHRTEVHRTLPVAQNQPVSCDPPATPALRKA